MIRAAHLDRARMIAALVGAAGLLACLAAGWFWPSRFFPAYLVGFLFWAGIGLGCLSLLMLFYLVGGAWGRAIRRPLEAGAISLVPMAILFVPIAFGLVYLYPWADPSVVSASEALRRKSGYLNPSAFRLRAAGYFVLWIGLALILNRWSPRSDREEEESSYRLQAVSGPGLVAYFLAATFAMIDWVMSLEPDWASTIYGAMLIVGHGLVGYAFAVGVAALAARGDDSRESIPREAMGDLGNLLLAFIMLWAYMAFSQFLIIWSGNLPEEISWYVRRIRGGWQWVAIGLIVFHFFAPFFVLMFHEAKRRAGTLLGVAAAVVALHFVDLCWLVLPARFAPRATRIPWDEVGLALVATAGIGGVFVASFLAVLGRRGRDFLAGPAAAPHPHNASGG